MRIPVTLFALLLTCFALDATADSANLNRSLIMNKTFSCSNGGTIKLIPTRYGNVNKVVFSKSGSLNQVGYVTFWNMTDFYKGDVFTSMTFPDPQSDELPVRKNNIADMVIKYDGQGLILNLTPVRANNVQIKFSCRNY